MESSNGLREGTRPQHGADLGVVVTRKFKWRSRPKGTRLVALEVLSVLKGPCPHSLKRES
jgi:hypothetical protein